MSDSYRAAPYQQHHYSVYGSGGSWGAQETHSDYYPEATQHQQVFHVQPDSSSPPPFSQQPASPYTQPNYSYKNEWEGTQHVRKKNSPPQSMRNQRKNHRAMLQQKAENLRAQQQKEQRQMAQNYSQFQKRSEQRAAILADSVSHPTPSSYHQGSGYGVSQEQTSAPSQPYPRNLDHHPQAQVDNRNVYPAHIAQNPETARTLTPPQNIHSSSESHSINQQRYGSEHQPYSSIPSQHYSSRESYPQKPQGVPHPRVEMQRPYFPNPVSPQQRNQQPNRRIENQYPHPQSQMAPQGSNSWATSAPSGSFSAVYASSEARPQGTVRPPQQFNSAPSTSKPASQQFRPASQQQVTSSPSSILNEQRPQLSQRDPRVQSLQAQRTPQPPEPQLVSQDSTQYRGFQPVPRSSSFTPVARPERETLQRQSPSPTTGVSSEMRPVARRFAQHPVSQNPNPAESPLAQPQMAQNPVSQAQLTQVRNTAYTQNPQDQVIHKQNLAQAQNTAQLQLAQPQVSQAQNLASHSTASSGAGLYSPEYMAQQQQLRAYYSQRPLAAQAVNLVKRYGEDNTAVTALKGINVGFGSGMFTAIMGPSGSGKSTLMHCLAGLDSVTSGQAFIGSTDVSSLNDSELTELRRDRLGFIFQAFNLVPTLTAEENITLPSDIAGREIDRAWFNVIVERLGLSSRLDHRPSELSGGQQQRVACARALVSRPAIIFGDEPTGNLDSNSSAEVLKILRTAVDTDGQTVVIVTHDAKAASYADRVVFLADGAIIQELYRPSSEDILRTMTQIEDRL